MFVILVGVLYLTFIFYVIKEDLQEFWKLIRRSMGQNDTFDDSLNLLKEDSNEGDSNIYYENLDSHSNIVDDYGAINSDEV